MHPSEYIPTATPQDLFEYWFWMAYEDRQILHKVEKYLLRAGGNERFPRATENAVDECVLEKFTKLPDSHFLSSRAIVFIIATSFSSK